MPSSTRRSSLVAGQDHAVHDVGFRPHAAARRTGAARSAAITPGEITNSSSAARCWPHAYGTYPTLRLGGPDDTDGGSTPRGRWIPTTSVEQYAATLATWYGLSSADLTAVFPLIGRFSTPNLGFLVVDVFEFRGFEFRRALQATLPNPELLSLDWFSDW